MTLSEQLRIACLLEATARKPGNVHPWASFDDLCYDDFVRAAGAVAPELARAGCDGVGEAILAAATATMSSAGTNVNLGTILLLAPLAAVPADDPLVDGIGEVLTGLTVEDSRKSFDAIRLLRPSGMGNVEREDITTEPTRTLVECMRLAAERDLVAREYVNGFDVVLNTGVPELSSGDNFAAEWEQTTIRLQLVLMSRFPDSLIARKCGVRTAEESAARARSVLDAGWPEATESQTLLQQFDGWLRADGHRRNPGTTADLVAASLFAAIRDGHIMPPSAEEVHAFASQTESPQ